MKALDAGMHNLDEGVSVQFETLLMFLFLPDHDAWRNKLAAWSAIAIDLKTLEHCYKRNHNYCSTRKSLKGQDSHSSSHNCTCLDTPNS